MTGEHEIELATLDWLFMLLGKLLFIVGVGMAVELECIFLLALLCDATVRIKIFTHSYLETRERVIGKQCIPRSDATYCGA